MPAAERSGEKARRKVEENSLRAVEEDDDDVAKEKRWVMRVR